MTDQESPEYEDLMKMRMLDQNRYDSVVILQERSAAMDMVAKLKAENARLRETMRKVDKELMEAFLNDELQDIRELKEYCAGWASFLNAYMPNTAVQKEGG